MHDFQSNYQTIAHSKDARRDGGDACIRDTRIAVWMLVSARQLGFADADLLARYDPPLSSSDLEAAWRYHASHRAEIDAAIQEHEEA